MVIIVTYHTVMLEYLSVLDACATTDQIGSLLISFAVLFSTVLCLRSDTSRVVCSDTLVFLYGVACVWPHPSQAGDDNSRVL